MQRQRCFFFFFKKKKDPTTLFLHCACKEFLLLPAHKHHLSFFQRVCLLLQIWDHVSQPHVQQFLRSHEIGCSESEFEPRRGTLELILTKKNYFLPFRNLPKVILCAFKTYFRKQVVRTSHRMLTPKQLGEFRKRSKRWPGQDLVPSNLEQRPACDGNRTRLPESANVCFFTCDSFYCCSESDFCLLLSKRSSRLYRTQGNFLHQLMRA